MGVSGGIIDSSLGVDGLGYGRPCVLRPSESRERALRTEMKSTGWKNEQGTGSLGLPVTALFLNASTGRNCDMQPQ